MNISVIGTGYVGLVAGACLSDFGFTVICVDTNIKKINDLQNGIIPIYEPGLTDLVVSNHESGRLQFTTDVAAAILRYRVSFPQTATFSGKLGNYLFMGKGIRIVGVELADFLNPVPIPQNATLSEEV